MLAIYFCLFVLLAQNFVLWSTMSFLGRP